MFDDTFLVFQKQMEFSTWERRLNKRFKEVFSSYSDSFWVSKVEMMHRKTNFWPQKLFEVIEMSSTTEFDK